ncbi:hypothetical protein GYMLUDRAFT_77127 [Collybiopsis luxurians FD-317 M1]|uniref:Uncharacterized protein n=1 Tax=Collybiopsis luxurians FD-317 M1 TaxID=944289 RepID=A0A0D0CHN3_9AGAR|nr:hypothetical protein GYMLUDRAFT_77127 [Collybiopsis luxurians FD-317 M1]
MNRPDMLRQQPAGMPQSMLGMGPPFLNNSPSSGPPNPNPMPNPGMRFPQQQGVIPGRPTAMNIRPGQNQSPMNPNVNIPGGGQPMQGMNFSANMVPQGGVPGVRRVASQPQMNAGGMAGHMPGMQQGPMNMGAMPQTGLPNPLRNPQQPNQLRAQLTGPPGAEMGGIGLNRSGPVPGNRGGPMPVMNSLSQPASMGGPSSGGMPNNNFQNMSGPHAGMNHSMGPGPSQPLHRMTPDMFKNFGGGPFPSGPGGGGGPGPGNVGNRSLSGSGMSMPGGGGIPISTGNNGQYPGMPSTPPNSAGMMIDSQPLSSNMGGTPNGTPNRPTSFNITPAQQFHQMQPNSMDGPMPGDNFGGNGHFGMHPPSVPPRPPSQTSHMHTNPSHPFSHPSQQTPMQHHSPHPSDINNLYPSASGPSPSRPHSQNQNPQLARSPSRSGSTQPRPHLPPGAIMPGPGGRLPGSQPGPQQQPGNLPSQQPPPPQASLPPHQQVRPQSSGGLMPGPSGPGPSLANIAPRPPHPGGGPVSAGPHPPLPPQQPPLSSASAPPTAGPSSHLGPHQLPPPPGPGQQQPLDSSTSPQSLTPPGSIPNPTNGPDGPPTRIMPGTVSGGIPIQSGPLPAVPPSMMRPPPGSNISPTALGHGQGLIRLLQFSGNLASESKQKHQLSWWNELIREYFTPKAIMRFTLWRDNQRNEAKPFEIGVPILPRFLLVTTQSGVKSMTLTLDGARERLYAYGHAIVECVAAVWTYKYNNGYTVALRGPLTVHVVVTAGPPTPPGAPPHPNVLLKFEDFQFDASYHDKYIALESIMGPRSIESPRTPRVRNAPPGAPAAAAGAIAAAGGSGGSLSSPAMNGIGSGPDEGNSGDQEDERKWEEPRVMIEKGFIPGEPVNAFGIPQATMRCLELAESVASMTDLIAFSSEHALGPIDALARMAQKIRESTPMNQPPAPPQQPMINGVPGFGPGPNHNPNSNLPPSQFGGPSGSSSGPSFHATNGIHSPSMTLYSSAPPSVTNPPSAHTPSTLTSSPQTQNASPSINNSPRKQNKTIPQSQQGSSSGAGVAGGSGGGGTSSSSNAASSNPSSAHNTPAMASASLKRKQASGSADAGPGTSDVQAPKRNTRKRNRTGG